MHRSMMGNVKVLHPVLLAITLAALLAIASFLTAPCAASVSAAKSHTRTWPGAGQVASSHGEVDSPARARINQNLMKLPIHFVPNKGQTDPRVSFTARGRGYSLFFLPTEIVIGLTLPAPEPAMTEKSLGTDQLEHPSRSMVPDASGREPSRVESVRSNVLNMQFIGANPSVRMKGREKLPGRANYLIGNNPAKWRTGIPTFARVKYENLYPGVDLVFYGRQGLMEYDLIVAPGVTTDTIRLRYSGAKKLDLDASGNLVVRLAGGEFVQRRPIIYQEINGKRQPVDGGFVLSADSEVGFEISSYDRRRPLIIDPALELTFSTYLGGSGQDYVDGMALDSSGAAYVTGYTTGNFPVENAYQGTLGGGSYDAFVFKFSADGSSLEYATYLGGSEEDLGRGIAVDASGAAYVIGSTLSDDFPVENAYQGTRWGDRDAFVAKLTADGSSLKYSTYLGGSNTERGQGIWVDSSGAAYATGYTFSSADFPLVNAYQGVLAGRCDVFVSKFSADGSSLEYSTYLGGSQDDAAMAIALDSSGAVYATGYTYSSDFPEADAYQGAYGGSIDAFVFKFSADGSSLEYSTYLGGSGGDTGTGIAVDSTGAAYVTGYTYSSDFPVANAYQGTLGGARDAFVSKFSADGSSLEYSTYLGGTSEDRSQSIALDSSGAAYVTGYTYSTDFPVAYAYQDTLGGGIDAFVSKLSADGTSLEYSTYLGGSGDDQGYGIALDSSSAAYVAGYTGSGDFPVANAYQDTNSGDLDAFVARIFLGYTLTVETSGSGTGTVSSSPDGIDCGNDCSEAYEEGESVTLTATPGSGSYFTGWSACSGDQSCTVSMDDDQSVTATFTEAVTYSLTVTKNGTGTGTVTSNPSGIDCGGDCSEAFEDGASVILTATPAAGSSFTGWSGECSGNGSCTVSMDGAKSVTATFTEDTVTYPLTVTKNGTGTGTVTSNPSGIDCGGDCSEAFEDGASVILTATPAAGSSFTGWSGECSGNGSCTVSMDAAKSVTATFTEDTVTYSLTVTKNGTGTGTVTSNPSGIDCGGDCSEAFEDGASVILTATPAAGSSFTGWSGECSGNESCTVSMDAAKSVTATFTEDTVTYSLTVTKNGTGTGTVTSNPSGIDCGGDCSEAFEDGASVILTATPAAGSSFTGWSGECSGNGSCTVSMDAAKSVTATFTEDTVTYSLTVTKNGTGTGTVTSNPSGIDCGGDCSEAFEDGTSVILTATPAAGSSFTGWSGECSGNGSCTVSMDAAKSVTATFTEDTVTYSLTVTKNGTGTGTVTSNPSGIDCGGDCSEAFEDGTSVILTATPAAGSSFTGWSGECSGNGSCTVSMDGAKSVTATFTEDTVTYSLTVTKNGTGTGTVTSNPSGIDCGGDCSEAFEDGASVILTATPAAGSSFSGWSGECSGNGSCTVSMDAAKSVTATFTEDTVTYSLTVTKNGTGTGTVTSNPSGIDCGGDCSEAFEDGASVILTATPAAGSSFSGWSGSCSGNESCTLSMDDDQSVTATFTEAVTYSLTVTKNGTGTGTVTSNPAGIDCGGDCSEAFEDGTSVILTATPAAGSSFSGWSGSCSGNESCTLSMDDDQSVTATFTEYTVAYSLTVTKNGTGTGTVTSNPAGIDCGDNCLADFPENTQVTLTASPDEGYALEGWAFDYPDTASCTGNGTCFFSMDQDYGVRATFTADSDGDGVANAVENQGPYAGDANQDGVSDYLQAGVATLQDIYGNWVTLIAEDDTWFRQVAAVDNPHADKLPDWVAFPGGLYQFKVENLSSGASTVVKMVLHGNFSVVAYLKWGPTPENSSEHWYSFDYDGTLGAEITQENGLTVINLHLQDGELGDDGLTADGEISDLGGAYSAFSTGGGSGGGCSCSSPVFASQGASASANFDISFLIIAVLGLVVAVIRRRGGTRTF